MPAKKKKKTASKKTDPVLAGQPSVNIGLIGHVDHGKTTLTERFSGVWTDTHSEELKRGITIRLGYADAVFYKCKKCGYTMKAKCPKCGEEAEAARKVSFIDAPGHESLMATMIAGSAIMDGAILLIAANEDCPQPQTMEHLKTLEITGVENVVIVQNKIDLVSQEQALANYEQIKKFVKGTAYEKAPIIPISAKLNVNIDVLIENIEKIIKTPKRDDKKDPLMLVARSFDINKPGCDPNDLVGGILGGAIKQGMLKEGDEIEIKPGRKVEERNQLEWRPLVTKIREMKTGGQRVDVLRPGGSVALMTGLDPTLVKSDSLSGSVVGLKGKLPPVFKTLTMELHLLERVVGSKEKTVVEPIKDKEILMLNVNSAATVGVVSAVSKKEVACALKLPVCAQVGSRVTISRRIGNRFRLIGYGIIKG